MKMLHRAYSGDPHIVKRFQREARAASRLDHPNSIAVLDFGEAEDGTLFMVMEYLDGKDWGRAGGEEFPLREKRIVATGNPAGLGPLRGPCEGDHPPRPEAGQRLGASTRRDKLDFVKVLDFGIAKLTRPPPKSTGHPVGHGGAGRRRT